jgi:hypothetical protein
MINIFYSHCWRDGRWAKFIALCFTHNRDVALLASLVYSLFAFVLQRLRLLPLLWGATKGYIAGREDVMMETGCWCFFGGPIVFLIFLIYWELIRATLTRQQTYVFLDKLCIHQTDEKLKTDGIRGIGGILKYSQQMVVLWSPQYFSRLWCLFEVAVWCALNRADVLLVVPLAKTVLLPVGMLFLYMVLSLAWIADKSGRQANILYIGGAFCFLCTCPIVHTMRKAMRDLFTLKDQLSKVTVTEAECFCCKAGHVHPDTKARMPCDRELVMNTIKELFPGEDSCLQLERKFRTEWLKRVLKTLGGPDSMPLRLCLIMVAPMMWKTADVLSSPTLSLDELLVRVALTRIIYLLEGIVLIRVFLFTCGCLSRRRRHWFHDCTISCIGASVFLALALAMYYKSFKAQEFRSHWPQILNGVMVVTILAVIFLRRCSMMRPRSRNQQRRHRESYSTPDNSRTVGDSSTTSSSAYSSAYSSSSSCDSPAGLGAFLGAVCSFLWKRTMGSTRRHKVACVSQDDRTAHSGFSSVCIAQPEEKDAAIAATSPGSSRSPKNSARSTMGSDRYVAEGALDLQRDDHCGRSNQGECKQDVDTPQGARKVQFGKKGTAGSDQSAFAQPVANPQESEAHEDAQFPKTCDGP